MKRKQLILEVKVTVDGVEKYAIRQNLLCDEYEGASFVAEGELKRIAKQIWDKRERIDPIPEH